MYKYLVIFAFVFAFQKNFAGHRAGGNFTWECIGPNTYVIQFTRNVSCNHLNDPDFRYCIEGSLPGDPNNGAYTISASIRIDYPIIFCGKICCHDNFGLVNYRAKQPIL